MGGFSLQPSEFSKVAFVLALSRYLMYRDNYRRFRGLAVPLAIALAPVVLILREPDLGTSLVFLPVLFVMLYAAGARHVDLCKLALCGLACLPVLWTQMSREQRSRVTALFEQTAPEQAPTDDGYHLHKAKQLLAMGGIWGSLAAGEPVDDPAAYRLPEDHTDFVFIVIIERLGWFGAATALGLVVALSWRGLAVAESTRGTIRPFGRGRRGGAVCGASADQYRHDGRLAAHHRLVVAVGQLRRFRTRRAFRGAGSARQHRPASWLRGRWGAVQAARFWLTAASWFARPGDGTATVAESVKIPGGADRAPAAPALGPLCNFGRRASPATIQRWLLSL